MRAGAVRAGGGPGPGPGAGAGAGGVAGAGANGLIGRRVVAGLAGGAGGGCRVKALVRDVGAASRLFGGRRGVQVVGPEGWSEAVAEGDCRAVVNLCGEPVATRWDPAARKGILESRIDSTKILVDAINACPEAKRPEVLVNASAIGFYGTSTTGRFDEASSPGDDFLARVCVDWEAEAAKVDPAVRLVTLRTGLVLDREGGVLGKMVPAFQMFAGGAMGSGEQWCSWVHHEDVVGIVKLAIESPEAKGPINAVSPQPVTNAQFSEALGRALGRPSWLPVPDFALKAALGDGAALVLEGQRVLPKKAQDLGYRFRYADVQEAVRAAV